LGGFATARIEATGIIGRRAQSRNREGRRRFTSEGSESFVEFDTGFSQNVGNGSLGSLGRLHPEPPWHLGSGSSNFLHNTTLAAMQHERELF
jgi:hypothetical protein